MAINSEQKSIDLGMKWWSVPHTSCVPFGMFAGVIRDIETNACNICKEAPVIDKLELLLALAQERHFGRAAEACGVTQPTMSTSIKQLEEILGVMLVQRGSRFQGFTPEGERVLDWARRIVSNSRAMREEIQGLKDKLSGEIKLAAIPTVLGMVASLTTPFRMRHPDVRFRVVSCTSAQVLGLLENLEVDAGLTYIENEPIGNVRTIPLYNESYRLLTAPVAM